MQHFEPDWMERLICGQSFNRICRRSRIDRGAATTARPIDLGPNRILFRQGDAPIGVFILTKGTAKLTRHSKGKEVLAARVGAGSLLGVPAVIGAKPYSLTAEAMKSAEFSLLPGEYFIHLMHTEPTLSFRLVAGSLSRGQICARSMLPQLVG